MDGSGDRKNLAGTKQIQHQHTRPLTDRSCPKKDGLHPNNCSPHGPRCVAQAGTLLVRLAAASTEQFGRESVDHMAKTRSQGWLIGGRLSWVAGGGAP